MFMPTLLFCNIFFFFFFFFVAPLILRRVLSLCHSSPTRTTTLLHPLPSPSNPPPTTNPLLPLTPHPPLPSPPPLALTLSSLQHNAPCPPPSPQLTDDPPKTNLSLSKGSFRGVFTKSLDSVCSIVSSRLSPSLLGPGREAICGGRARKFQPWSGKEGWLGNDDCRCILKRSWHVKRSLPHAPFRHREQRVLQVSSTRFGTTPTHSIFRWSHLPFLGAGWWVGGVGGSTKYLQIKVVVFYRSEHILQPWKIVMILHN